MKARAKSRGRCVLCGSTKNIQKNHYGGQNHMAWFTGPWCGSHHDQFHELARNAEIDLRYTADPIERSIRVSKLLQLAEWMNQEALRQAHQQQSKKGRKRTNE